MSQKDTSALNSASNTNVQVDVFQEYVKTDASCCVVSVNGQGSHDPVTGEGDGFRFVEVSLFQQEGHWQPKRWQRLKQAWRGKPVWLEFYNPETLDTFIGSLKRARAAIWAD